LQKYTIVTNNPDVVAKYPDISSYREGDVSHIFVSVRDEIHKGALLVSHPLSGSIKPNESPYKSVVVDLDYGKASNFASSVSYGAPGSSCKIDFKSLSIIEDAIAVLKKFPVKNRNYSESVLEDFRVIDLDLVKSAIKE